MNVRKSGGLKCRSGIVHIGDFFGLLMQTLLFNELFDTPYEFLFEEHNALYEALVHLERHLQSSEKLSPTSCELIHPETICIQEGVRIAKHVQIEGPCFIGSGTEIRPGAYIRGGCFIGKDCVIGASSEVKHSILLDGVHLAHHNYVGDSIIGNNVNLSSAVTCANLRLDRASIKIRFEGRRIDTGLTKLGAIIGDGAFLGCHVLCNPGAVIAKNAKVQPKAIVSGYLAH